ncbi:uncharacterized protein LY89DRAFT_736342 [Mollisia scopiformis]|uniref:RRM domain-containing protein n=1 Tax=Mollisia scopiformis TaxID=149040 RepID=A0A194X269_MOLSC|nr:uncharacterized protein LY89DRAFT_736342 [Mollisia scopiformis]KUJ14296.1 hypothetical protein LY89DRAFT_736342 [Mollisia scopiformis]
MSSDLPYLQDMPESDAETAPSLPYENSSPEKANAKTERPDTEARSSTVQNQVREQLPQDETAVFPCFCLVIADPSEVITTETLIEAFRTHDGFLEACLATQENNPDLTPGYSYIAFNTEENATHAMRCLKTRDPDTKTYLMHAWTSKEISDTLEIPLLKHYPGVDLDITLPIKTSFHARVEELPKADPKNRGEFARAHLQMWDSLFKDKGLEFQKKAPGYILTRIFKEIDLNILDIRELQPGFEEIKDLHPSKTDSQEKRRNRRLYFAAISDLSENLVILDTLGTNLEEYPPLPKSENKRAAEKTARMPNERRKLDDNLDGDSKSDKAKVNYATNSLEEGEIEEESLSSDNLEDFVETDVGDFLRNETDSDFLEDEENPTLDYG